MTWSYRIVKRTDGRSTWYAVHEVHYDADGKPWGMTKEPASFLGENARDVREGLALALADAVKRPVLVEPKKWPGRAP